MIGHDHRKQTDGDPKVGKCEKPDCPGKGCNFTFAIQRAPRKESNGRRSKRYWREQRDIWPREPAQSDSMIHQGGPDTDNANRDDDASEANAAIATRRGLDLSIRLQNKPAGSQKPVTKKQCHASQ